MFNLKTNLNLNLIIFLFISLSIVFCYGSLGNPSVQEEYKSRIAGGKPARIRDHKYHAHLYPNDCGGTIIGTKYIMSAYVCRHNDLTVQVGYEILIGVNRGEYEVESCIVYNEKRGQPFSKDFRSMLVTLKKELVFGATVGSAIVGNSKHLVKEGYIGHVVGFQSKITASGYKVQQLYSVDIPIFSGETCRKTNPAFTEYIAKENGLDFCAGYDDNYTVMGGEHSTCMSDIGNGFVVDGSLAGISVESLGCGIRNKPGIFEAVWYMTNPWLFDHVYYDYGVKYYKQNY